MTYPEQILAQPLPAGRSVTANSWGASHMDRCNWLSTPVNGALFSGVITARNQVDADLTEVQLWGHDETALVTCSLEVGMCYTIYDFYCDSLEPMILCQRASSLVIAAAPVSADSCSRMVELCAGIGGIGVGAEKCEFQIVGHVDKNRLVIERLKRMGKLNIHHGDLTQDSVIGQLHASLSEPAHCYAAGFSCQPFSYQGDQGGLTDPRSGSFWATLRVAYLCGAKILLLECTPGAGRSPRLRAALQDFAMVMNFQIHELYSKLSDQWAARRDRWWAILYPADWPVMRLRPWDTDPNFQMVRQIFPVWPIWTHIDYAQLVLTKEEMELYFQVFPDKEGRVLLTSQPAPVLLHSYGSATNKCPCECRSAGFTAERLGRDGLRGVVIPHADGYRFLHPQEMALLLGYPLDLAQGDNHKATMCLLGQLASPLQAIWILGHMRQILEVVWNLPKGFGPSQLLEQHKETLMFQKHHLWAFPDSTLTKEISIATNKGSTLQFTRLGLTKVGDLLQAERLALDFGCSAELFDGGEPVPIDAFLQDQGFHGQYRLDYHGPGDNLLLAKGCVALIFHHQTQAEWILMPAGTMVFEALQGLGHFGLYYLQDVFGRRWGMDARLWHSVDLYATQVFGAGTLLPGSGLSMDFIALAVKALLALLPPGHDAPFVTGLAFRPGLGVVHFGPDLLAFPGDGKSRYFCLLMDHHWWLVACKLEIGQQEFTVRYWDGFQHSALPQCMERFICFLENWWLLDCAIVGAADHATQTQPDSCGTIMLAHLASELFGQTQFDRAQAEQIHPTLQTFAALLGMTHGLRGAAPSAAETQVLQQLATILVDKGVPQDKVQERALMALKKIGLQELQTALSSNNPWLYLKAVGSRPHVSFQWIKGDELQQKIRQKASSKFTIQSSERKKKGKKAAPEEPLCIDPSQLQLVTNTFFAQGKPVNQIAFATVGPDAVGIAFATASELAPFLQAGKVISKQPLGVLTTTPIPPGQTGVLHVETIRFPAQYKATNEPLLIQGSLVMLGSIAITRGENITCKLDAIPTQSLRLAVYKDQWPNNWDMFLQQPVRELLKAVPTLSLCKSTGCGVSCGKYHHEDLDEALDNLIMDLWSRSWHKADGRFCKPADAESWSALVRVPASAQLVLQGLSGQAGLYVEPRSDTGKEADQAYGVIWLGNVSLQEAHHQMKMTANAVALARIHNKYGVRLPAAHMEDAHKQHHPDEPFTTTKVQDVYRLYPVPWGTQRAALQRCLNEWGWKARVLQTTGGGAEGSTWEVGAAQPPPANVLQDKAGDIVVTHLRSSSKDPKPAPILASASTKQHIKAGSTPAPSSSSDPWVAGADPWGGYQGLAPSITKMPATDSAAAADRFKQMETRLHSNLQEQISAAIEKSLPQGPQAMEVQNDEALAANELRFQKLEAGVTELQAQGVKFEGWFTQMHQTDQFLTTQIQETNARLDAVSSSVTHQVGSIQHEMNSMRGEMTSGFANIEALLSKSRKTE